jgi:hypothetical protein
MSLRWIRRYDGVVGGCDGVDDLSKLIVKVMEAMAVGVTSPCSRQSDDFSSFLRSERSQAPALLTTVTFSSRCPKWAACGFQVGH